MRSFGRGRFVEDAPQPNQAYAVFVRSPHAHARIRSIDVAAARAAKGVVAVLTHKEIEARASARRRCIRRLSAATVPS